MAQAARRRDSQTASKGVNVTAKVKRRAISLKRPSHGNIDSGIGIFDIEPSCQ